MFFSPNYRVSSEVCTDFSSFENWKCSSEGLFSTKLPPSSKQHNEELSNLISLDNCSQVQCAWDAATVRPVVKVNHERILLASTKMLAE